MYRKSNNVVVKEKKERTLEEKIEEEGKMSVRWETEGLQTVGIVCLVIMFLKLMHLLGLIDITETGEATWERGSEEEDKMKRRGWSVCFLIHINICECCLTQLWLNHERSISS